MCERNCQHCYMRRSNKDAKRFMCFPVLSVLGQLLIRHMYMIIWNGFIKMELVPSLFLAVSSIMKDELNSLRVFARIRLIKVNQLIKRFV